MSETAEIPQATDAAAGQPNGQGNGAADSRPDSTGATGAPQTDSQQESSGQGGGDLISRVRSDPDYAEDRVRFFQSQAGKAGERVKTLESRMGDLAPLIERFGGDEIAVRANAAMALLAHPEYADAVRAAASGQPIPSLKQTPQGGESEDDYEDPLERQIREQREEIQNLKQQLGQTAQRFTARQMQGEIEGHFQRAFDGYDFTDEQKQAIFDGAAKTIATLPEQHLSSLDARGWELMLQSQLPASDLREAAIRHDARTREQRAGLSTDGRSQVNPAQTEQNLTGSPREVAAQALARLRAQEGRS